MQKLIGDLLTFSRVSKTKVSETNVNIAIDEALSLVEAQAKVKSVQIIKEYGDDLLKIITNQNQIQQVIINLCNNAIDSMSDGGTIKITTRNVIASETKQSHIEISISDTGSGIPEDVKSRIFEPFFTTKEVGKGTGLGLSLCYEIIQKHNGIIEVKSEIGKGTTFIMKLPV